MARSVIWTELAWQDLERLVDTIAQDSPTYAASFARRVWKRAQSLDELPYRGRVVPELGDPNVRELILKSYRLLYEIRGETVYVLGLDHDVVLDRDEQANVQLDDQGDPGFIRILPEYDCFPMSDLSKTAREEVEAAREARAAARKENQGQPRQ